VEKTEAGPILSITRTAKVGPLEKDKKVFASLQHKAAPQQKAVLRKTNDLCLSAAQGCLTIRLFLKQDIRLSQHKAASHNFRLPRFVGHVLLACGNKVVTYIIRIVWFSWSGPEFECQEATRFKPLFWPSVPTNPTKAAEKAFFGCLTPSHQISSQNIDRKFLFVKKIKKSTWWPSYFLGIFVAISPKPRRLLKVSKASVLFLEYFKTNTKSLTPHVCLLTQNLI